MILGMSSTDNFLFDEHIADTLTKLVLALERGSARQIELFSSVFCFTEKLWKHVLQFIDRQHLFLLVI